jgi:hypothetical protein
MLPVALREPMAKTPKTPKSEKVEFMATPQWVRKFDREAERLGISLSAYIRQACEEKHGRDHRKPPAD